MLKDEFLLMQEQDLETSDDSNLKNLLEVFELVLKRLPSNTDIDSKKSVSDCYKEMEYFARKHAKSGCFSFNSKQVIDFVSKYLEVNDLVSNSADNNTFVDLGDFL